MTVVAVNKLSLAHQTMFAELAGRCGDASFDEQFSFDGSFVKVPVKKQTYWYYSGRVSPSDTGRKRLYVGPVEDPEIARRVEAFKTNKVDYKERQAMVRSLVSAGLPATTGLLGDVVGAISRAGFFRLRGVLVGTVAFQAYSGFLGVRMPGNTLMTGDADFAQFHSISHEVNDSMPPIIDVLRAVDPTFTAVPHMTDTMAATKFRNAGKLDVEFLTPNRGSDDHQGRPRMPALGGASAEPLRFLDFLIRDPVQSVLLHKGGVPVTVPAPERYAVHKLIVSVSRKEDVNGRQKSRKDLAQSALLAEGLEAERRLEDVGSAWIEAWDRGPQWRGALSQALRRLPDDDMARFGRAVAAACKQDGREGGDYGVQGERGHVP
jgi:hypothetical protein